MIDDELDTANTPGEPADVAEEPILATDAEIRAVVRKADPMAFKDLQ